MNPPRSDVTASAPIRPSSSVTAARVVTMLPNVVEARAAAKVPPAAATAFAPISRIALSTAAVAITHVPTADSVSKVPVNSSARGRSPINAKISIFASTLRRMCSIVGIARHSVRRMKRVKMASARLPKSIVPPILMILNPSIRHCAGERAWIWRATLRTAVRAEMRA